MKKIYLSIGGIPVFAACITTYTLFFYDLLEGAQFRVPDEAIILLPIWQTVICLVAGMLVLWRENIKHKPVLAAVVYLFATALMPIVGIILLSFSESPYSQYNVFARNSLGATLVTAISILIAVVCNIAFCVILFLRHRSVRSLSYQ